MRSISQILCLSALLFAGTTVHAQMTYTGTGGNAMIPEVLTSVDQPDGTMLVKTMSSGFTWTNEEGLVGGNGSFECSGSNLMSAEGEQLDGAGSCEGMDVDGDVWWLWYNGGMEGEFGFTGGTGKYAGIDGGGTWKALVQYPDGKFSNQWEGSWTIPAQEMVKPEPDVMK